MILRFFLSFFNLELFCFSVNSVSSVATLGHSIATLAALRASGAAVEGFLRERLQSGQRIGFFQGKPIRWMCYLIAHDSHHRGQIALALKQKGMRLPEKVALREVWYPWYGRDF